MHRAGQGEQANHDGEHLVDQDGVAVSRPEDQEGAVMADGGKGYYEGEAGDAMPRALDSNRLAETVPRVHATRHLAGAGRGLPCSTCRTTRWACCTDVSSTERGRLTRNSPAGSAEVKGQGNLESVPRRAGRRVRDDAQAKPRQGSHDGLDANVSPNTLMLMLMLMRMAARATAGLNGLRRKADATRTPRRRAHPKLSPQAYGRIIPKSVRMFAGDQETEFAV